MSTFRIISFDGGGIRGALSTRILKRLWDKKPQLLKGTNLFAGTSTGGLISLTLAYGLNAQDVDNLYCYENIKKIFTPKRFNLIHPRFKNKELKDFITSIVPIETRISDLKKLIFIPAFNLQGITKDHWQGVFFNNIKENPTYNEKIVDVAIASSAAPTYFPSHNNYIDGGVITNSPAIAAVITTMHNAPGKYKLDDFRVISIGTGITPKRIKSKTTNWGILQWALRPFFTVKLPLISVLLNDTVPLEDLYCRELLRDNYHRINPILLEDIDIDDYKKVPILKEAANKYNLEKANSFIRERFLR